MIRQLWFNSWPLIGLFVGAVVARFSTRSGSVRMPQGTPPTDYEILTQPQLLASFSDSIGPNGITPRSMRDFVASTITTIPGGLSSIPIPLPGWTIATRPTGLAGPAMGFNYDLQQLDMWDDRTGTWVNPTFNGGTVTGATVFTSNVGIDGTLGVAGGADFNSTVAMPNLPTSASGQVSGTFWNNGHTVSITP